MDHDTPGDDDGTDRPPAGLEHHHPRPQPTRLRPRVLVAVLLAVAAAAAVGTAFAGVGPALADQAVLGEAIDLRSGALTRVAVVITDAGSTLSMGVLAGLLTLWLLWTHRSREAVFVAVTAGGAALLFTGLKRVLDRPRPPVVDHLVGATNESLPSGHATMSAAVVGSLVVLLWAGCSAAGRIAVVSAAALWVVAVGLTRIYLGVHWFSDVVAGWLVGGAWLAVCAIVLTAARRRVAAT
jgi:membrane-associated phospholipid phosphatase